MKIPKVDQYFLTADAPIGKYRRLDMRKIRNWLIGIGTVAIIGVLFMGNDEVNRPSAPVSADSDGNSSQSVNMIASSAQKEGDFYLSGLSSLGTGNRRSSAGRQLSASQIVKAQGGGLGMGLSSGTNIPARLLNRIVTADSRSPVMAIITGEISSPSGLAIPVGTKILGNAQSEAGTNRVQVSFHTFVFENGIEQPFSGVAVMPDGSNGIAGEYHSQMLKKESGRFIGTFVSGFAQGFKDKEQGAILPFEPGGLKNAALSGLSESASEQAKAYAEEMKNIAPYVTVEAGTPFLVFLERGLAL